MTETVRRNRFLVALFYVIPAALLAGVVYAQDGVQWDPVAWGSNPGLAALALAGAVAWLRQTAWGKRVLDGPVNVGAASVIIGSAGGVGLQWAHLLAVPRYADIALPWGGIAYGVSLAVFNITGIAVWNYFTSKIRPVNVTTVQPLGFAATAAVPQSIVEYIMSLLRGLLPVDKIPAGVKAVIDLIAQFAQSEAILTDDLRADIQIKVLKALRKAGLVGVDL